jgi:hypothetical protein
MREVLSDPLMSAAFMNHITSLRSASASAGPSASAGGDSTDTAAAASGDGGGGGGGGSAAAASAASAVSLWHMVQEYRKEPSGALLRDVLDRYK